MKYTNDDLAVARRKIDAAFDVFAKALHALDDVMREYDEIERCVYPNGKPPKIEEKKSIDYADPFFGI